MKHSLRFLSTLLVIIMMTGTSACKNPTDSLPDKSVLKSGAPVDYRFIERSVADWTKAIEAEPTSSKAFAGRGGLKSALGDQKGAIEDFTKAIELDQKSVTAHSARAAARFTSGDINGAVADFVDAAALFVLSKIGNGNSAVE